MTARKNRATARTTGRLTWRSVLGFPAGSRPTDAIIRARHRELIRIHHPDVTGDHAKAAQINAARDEALNIGAHAPNAHLATERRPKKRKAA